VIASAPTRVEERRIAPHTVFEATGVMRQIVRACLAAREGVVLDPFIGGRFDDCGGGGCGVSEHRCGVRCDVL